MSSLCLIYKMGWVSHLVCVLGMYEALPKLPTGFL